MSWRSWHFFLVILVLGTSLAAAVGAPAQAQEGEKLALVLTAEGPVTPLMREYLRRGIRTAEQRGAEVLVFELNTPGGSVDIMNSMVEVMLSSPVPIVVYVAPRGAMAGSAGTVITLAGHAAAMAPETAIGAASPIGAGGADLEQTADTKLRNMLKATVRSLSERRGPRAVELAEATIDSAEAVSANEALEAGLIDFVASDLQALLRELHGVTVQLEGGERTLDTQEAQVVRLQQSFIEQFLSVLTNPNIVVLLLNIGVIAILIEISSPGGWVAGFFGVVCLALAVLGLGIIPVNWFGMIFLVLAFALFILELNTPTSGALTVAGIGSLILAMLVLFNTPNVPGFPRVSVPLAVASSLISGAMFLGILMFAMRSQKIPPRMGQESLVGRTGTVNMDLTPRGQVQVAGELWTAELADASQAPLPRGSRVRVVAVRGLRLTVEKAE